MNHYPLWKNLLIIVVILFGGLYAMPNMYGEDLALQISPQDSIYIDQGLVDELEARLKQDEVSYSGLEWNANRLLMRVPDETSQQDAARLLRRTLAEMEVADRYIVALTHVPKTPFWLSNLGAAPMVLGLDLQGGVHFLMQVDMETALDQQLDLMRSDVRTLLRENEIRFQSVREVEQKVMIQLRDQAETEQALGLIEEQMPDLRVETGGKAGEIELAIPMSKLNEIRATALDQNITTLRNRVNELGVAEPLVQQQGEDRIVVQLPGVQDPSLAKRILSATATLEYRAVDMKNDAYTAHTTGRIPAGSRLYYERTGAPVLLKKELIVSGDQLVDARSGMDSQTGQAQVSVTLNSLGANRMREFTLDNVGNGMAVVYIERKPVTRIVNGEMVKETRVIEDVISVANIKEPFGKRFRTTGLDQREARDLALLLRAGALAAPVEIIEERTVGPSLGQENIDKGFKSVLIGFVAVLIFMLLTYKVFGLVANVALFANLLLIMAVLSLLGATLTLPGIAGIVLTVGMAVDANVLIFERIREELRLGNSPHASINAGYDKAFSTIADANITTLIAAVVLFSLGTGPVKGFAITLSIGILTSMFTAIMASRMMVNFIYGRKTRLKKLAI